MSALGQLAKALAAKNTLPWVLKHAKDGDRDAALAKAWSEERNIRTMSLFCERFWVSMVRAVCATPRCFEGPFFRRCYCHRRGRRWSVCDTCCNTLRSKVRAPKWSEVE